MEYITKELLISGFTDLGLKTGDTILVHSSLSALGITADMSRESLLQTYYEAITEVIGESGTLCVPSYFYEYARNGEPFDVMRSPISKELGIFPPFVRSKKGSVRSSQPLTSITSLGEKAEYISGGNCFTSYGVDSAWDRLHKLNAKIVCIAAKGGLTYAHYIEHISGVPHIYNKLYHIPVLRDTMLVSDKSVASVRYLDYGISYDIERWFDDMQDAGVIKTVKCGNGIISSMHMHNVFDFTTNKFKDNIYYLLTKAPEFIKGKIPDDGPAMR